MGAMPKLFLIVGLVAAALLFSGCVEQGETYCRQDSDCACGTHISTEDCFAGNKAFVDTESQCPDYCTGIAGNLETRCVESECIVTPKP